VKIHLHAPCWNEELLLPFFLKHYLPVVDQFFIYDDGSTDASRDILRQRAQAHVVPFSTEGSSYVEAIRQLCNQCWKVSRGVADWVVVCNVDEHLYHADGLRRYLRACLDDGISVVPSASYEMVTDRFPKNGSRLSKTVRSGVPTGVRSECGIMSDKLCIFNPNRVDEINYAVGRHEAQPTGDVVWPTQSRPLLLHYKYLGFAYLQKRYRELNHRRRSADVELRHGFQYEWDELELRRKFDRLHATAAKVIPSFPRIQHLRRLFRLSSSL
jgi:hypothetical protein